MKFKKQLFCVLALISVSALLLTACGNKPAENQETTPAPKTEAVDVNNTETEDKTNTATENNTEAQVEATDFKTIVVDVGGFTFEMPDTWKAFPQTDVFGEKDEQGNYPIDPNYIYISKEAQNELELFTKPAVSIRRYDIDTELADSKEWYVNVEDMDVSIQDVQCSEAYTGESDIAEGWEYQVLTFAVNGGQFSVTIPTMANGEPTGLSYDVPEVNVVLESLASVTTEETPNITENIAENNEEVVEEATIIENTAEEKTEETSETANIEDPGFAVEFVPDN